MITSIQSKFFTLLLSGLSVIGMFFQFPHNARAGTIGNIPSTGGFCVKTPQGNCVDQNYTMAANAGPFGKAPLYALPNSLIAGTAPGFIPAPPGSMWVAPLGDTGCCLSGSVFDFRVSFVTGVLSGPLQVTSTVAALGAVAVSVDGVGGFGGPQSLTTLNPIVITVKSGATTHTIDYVFSGCLSWPSCSGSNEPVSALLVDPTWRQVAPGTPLNTIPLSVLFAAGGVAPVSPVPEPGSMLLLGSGLVAIAGAARRKLLV